MSTESKKAKRDKHRERRQRRGEKLRQEREESAKLVAAASASLNLVADLRQQLEDARAKLYAEQNRSEALVFQLAEATMELSELRPRMEQANCDVVRLSSEVDVIRVDRRALKAEVERYRAEDRDVLKLRRRLQEREAVLEETRRQLSQAREQIPPKPLIIVEKARV
jgi:chromosome segregation ATPase